MTAKYSTAYTRLRDRELAKSTRPFLAKGKSVKRCSDCQMGEFACMCAWRPRAESAVDFVLLMHRKELFKPTNTGRLIVDAFAGTPVFLWNRLEAPGELADILQDPARNCFIVFPADGTENGSRPVVREIPRSKKKTTLILLDGTWKQCSRMIGLSRWLDPVPCLSLPESLVRSYAVRDSGRDHRFSTAEAAISCLLLMQQERAASALQNYFRVFNQHYLATRGCYQPARGECHAQLEALLSE
ncbi:tRNA-uridine aminocarboxypropyltransferase [Microbulbifer elongatus]|uniref:tRNA-uridine aminocarboxypropyltransferase n=1 Tax=Microbulbifer elongatus TaxID=86173 RepID=A0ABT1NXI6_9GAMM|nr:DTW domain-containing protein [Microbulbifer elongatus]MCQ3828516.1 DTW domain-containing protein [Microbulbifer elongatus]